jgi:serine/threonine protein kinase
MNAGFWLQVEELLGQALLLEGSRRSDFVAAIADRTVRAEVESLLHAEAAPDFHIESVIGSAAEIFSVQPEEAGFSKRFQIMRQAGHGGMGRVFEAIDRERSLRVALKSLTKLSPMHLYSFKQEFRSLAGVVHPNLVTLYELFQEGDEFYLSMEFIEGVGFLDYVRQPVFNPERLRAVLRQVTAGLTAIHAAGKVHRDLKPSNLMVAHNGRAVILDFGLVSEVEREHFGVQTEMLMGGTPGYLPPEQATGILSPAGDWYSLGVILFEALTGRLPFAGAQAEVADLLDGCPQDLARLCQALLFSDPDARPTGAEVMKLLGGDGTAMVPLPQPALFVDREEPLSQIEDAFSALMPGGNRRSHAERGGGKRKDRIGGVVSSKRFAPGRSAGVNGAVLRTRDASLQRHRRPH